MTNMPFDFNAPSEYMSVEEPQIPEHLEQKAKIALALLEEVQREFNHFMYSHEMEVTQREEEFEDAMSHFKDTENEWVRVENEDGVSWIHVSNFEIEIPEWMKDLEEQDEKDLLEWGSV